jgi:hypothetical protein
MLGCVGQDKKSFRKKQIIVEICCALNSLLKRTRPVLNNFHDCCNGDLDGVVGQLKNIFYYL